VEVFRKLVGTGVERQYAARLVEFLPMAYGRLLLGKAGIHFSEMFQRMTPSGDLTAEQQLSSEPVWEEVVSFAQAEARRGASKEDVLAVAGRSAELDVVNQLLKQGSKPEDLILTTASLKWSQEGPPL
jgi:hypothetical protein